jgi:magnesium transporter
MGENAMVINSFQINETLQLIPLDPEMAAEAHQQKDARIWVDLQGFKSNELGEWLDKLEVTGLSRKLCLEALDRPGFYPLKNEIVLVIPVLSDTELSQEADYLVFLCRENLLLTFHKKPVEQFADVRDSESWLPERSIAGLVSAIMIDFSLTDLQHTTNLRNSIHALEERMDQAPDKVEAEQILDIRSEILILGAVVSDQLPSLMALWKTDKPFFKREDAQDYLNCAVANLKAADRSLDWLDGRASALRSGFEMHAQDKTNRRLNVLTILSAIFNPATLLAGIWGMNFVVMPELKIPFAYPIALGMMVLLGAGMFFFFRKHGWFD